jgi:thiol-disulfide isomerase/thioredoxin
MRIFGTLVAAFCAIACSSKYSPPTGGDDDGSNMDQPDAGPIMPPEPDAPPAPKPYPEGPYGTGQGDTIDNLAWEGYSDTTADTDADPFNEAPHTVTLEEFYAERDPGAKILLVSSEAGWCGPCQEEAAELPAFAAEWTPKGVRFLTAMLENSSGGPASVAYAKTWGDAFDLTTPVVADPDAKMDPYFVDNGIPFNLFIETKTMTIVAKMSGFDRNEAEAIFNAHME